FLEHGILSRMLSIRLRHRKRQMFSSQRLHIDIECSAETQPGIFQFERPVSCAIVSKMVPDVLRLPEADFAGEQTQGLCNIERLLQLFERMMVVDGEFEAVHRSLHALACG